MTSREKSKGHSLAWHSNNGVNDDEQYDSKQWPLSRADRAARLASRLSLVSMSTHTAMLQQHFVDPIIAKRPQQEVKEEEKKEVDPVPSRYGFPQELV